MRSFLFYQNMVCPHESSFIRSLASRQDVQVTWVVDTDVLPYRRQMGISRPDCGRASVIIPKNEEEIRHIVDEAGTDAVHIVQGPRGGFSSRTAWSHCLKKGHRVGLFCEPGDHRGAKGLARKLLYKYEALTWGRYIQFVLATGKLGVNWYVQSGYPKERVFPFCYVVETPDNFEISPMTSGPYHIIYSGQLIRRKNVDLLLKALHENINEEWILSVVGDGPLRQSLIDLAKSLVIGGRIQWLGVLPNTMIPAAINHADLFVLPSDFDGWGAVVSEALMVGTPVICSQVCGASDLLLEERRGGVFSAGALEELSLLIQKRIAMGKVTNALRQKNVNWAQQKISGEAVSSYFLEIIDHVYKGKPCPQPPWHV